MSSNLYFATDNGKFTYDMRPFMQSQNAATRLFIGVRFTHEMTKMNPESSLCPNLRDALSFFSLFFLSFENNLTLDVSIYPLVR